jgi:integrase
MANDSPEEKYRQAREKLREEHEAGNIADTDYDLIAELCNAYDPNEYSATAEKTWEYSTLYGATRTLTVIARRMPIALSEATAMDVNELMSRLRRGDHEDVKDDGLSASSIREYQVRVRSLYRYHDSLDVDHENITLADKGESPIDTDDLYTDDEIQRMREACPNARDRCLLELFINTGQRVRAIQTLRIKDVWPNEGEFRLNPTVDGLKAASGRRALFGARAAVTDWLQYHPTNDPNDYLITGVSDNQQDHEYGDSLSRTQIYNRLQRIGEVATIEKPVNPHQFRHYSVTMMYREYGLTLDQIRWQIGHDSQSRVLEATYRHLTDEDRIEEVEQQAGFREEDEDASPFTPPVCVVCDEPLSDDARYCPSCGESYTPDAKKVDEQLDDAIYEGKGEAETEAQDDAVDAFREAIEENPQLKEEIYKLIED